MHVYCISIDHRVDTITMTIKKSAKVLGTALQNEFEYKIMLFDRYQFELNERMHVS